jgi:hypothetical protein
MIEPELARQLKQAGLEWQPTKGDTFMIPGGELAEEVFTLNDQTILIQTFNDEYAVTFHGSVEWALDHVMLADVIWLPNETQLREAIQQRLGGDGAILLYGSQAGYRCSFIYLDQERVFQGLRAEEAYAQALLYLLRRESQPQRRRWVETA